MAVANRKIDNIQDKPEAAPRAVRLAGAHEVASPSPARTQQEALEAIWAQEPDLAANLRPWSPRRTFAFIALTCGGFWAAVIILAARLLR